jgi:hypothetical protein
MAVFRKVRNDMHARKHTLLRVYAGHTSKGKITFWIGDDSENSSEVFRGAKAIQQSQNIIQTQTIHSNPFAERLYSTN